VPKQEKDNARPFHLHCPHPICYDVPVNFANMQDDSHWHLGPGVDAGRELVEGKIACHDGHKVIIGGVEIEGKGSDNIMKISKEMVVPETGVFALNLRFSRR
jgi:hypothetical protein